MTAHTTGNITGAMMISATMIMAKENMRHLQEITATRMKTATPRLTSKFLVPRRNFSGCFADNRLFVQNNKGAWYCSAQREALLAEMDGVDTDGKKVYSRDFLLAMQYVRSRFFSAGSMPLISLHVYVCVCMYL